MKRTLKNSVVVVTGASSGIGRAAAEQFARKGANVVLAARDDGGLQDAAEACRAAGAEVLIVPTDVALESEVETLAETAVKRFGRIDVWVNDAAVYMMGTFEDTPTEAFRDLFDVNVMGYVHGAKAALRRFRAQGSGVLIHVGSQPGLSPYALSSAYCMSKHAVHAMNDVLHQELQGTDIHTCVVAPATVDTPLFQHAANFTGREIKAMKPIYDAERVAAEIVACAERPKRVVTIGAMPKIAAAMHVLAPEVKDKTFPKQVEKDHLSETPAIPSLGNFHEPTSPHAVTGGWKEREKKSSAGKAMAIAGALLVPLVAIGVLAR